MGVLKIATPVLKTANNPTFKGVGITKTPSYVDEAVDLATNVTSSVAFSLGSKVLTRSVPALFVASTLYDVGSGLYNLYKSYTSEPSSPIPSEPVIAEDGNKVEPKYIPEKIIEGAVNVAKANLENVKAKNDEIASTLTNFEGTTLPEHMANNTSALVGAINHLSEVIAKGTSDITLGSFSIGQTLSDFGLMFEHYANQGLKTESVKLGSSMSVTTDFSDKFNEVLDLNKQVLPKQYEKADLQIDDLTFRKTDKSIVDLDGLEVANISPREAELIKNATVSRKTTDENNLEFDEEDFDIMDSLPDITAITTYESRSELIEKIMRNEPIEEV